MPDVSQSLKPTLSGVLKIIKTVKNKESFQNIISNEKNYRIIEINPKSDFIWDRPSNLISIFQRNTSVLT